MGRVTEQALKRYAEGEASAAELAKELGVTPDAIHRARRRRGIPPQHGRAGHAHWNWRGGRHVTTGGYVKVRASGDHLLAHERDKDGYVFEHRAAMAASLKRPLRSFETVHHKNGDHSDNAISNLQLRVGAHGPGVVLCCAECGSQELAALDL